MAHRVQKSEQTKEQTKLIAQGIAKGIELYKKEQSAKSRERDRARKRSMRMKQKEEAGPASLPGDPMEASEDGAGPDATTTLRVGGIVFGALAAAHLLRLFAGWTLWVGTWDVPLWVSMAAAVLLAGLSFWFFYMVRILR